MKKVMLSNQYGYFREYNLELKEGRIEYAFLKQASVEDVKMILPLLASCQREAYEQHYGLTGKKPVSLKKIRVAHILDGHDKRDIAREYIW